MICVNKKQAAYPFIDKFGRTPIYLAAEGGSLGELNKVLSFYTKDSLSDVINMQDTRGSTALMRTAINPNHSPESYDIAKVLLQHGANPAIKGNKGYTAAHYAATHNTCNLVDLLLRYGADIHAVTDNGWTLLHSAVAGIASGRITLDTIELLMKNRLTVESSSLENLFGDYSSYVNDYNTLFQKYTDSTNEGNSNSSAPLVGENSDFLDCK